MKVISYNILSNLWATYNPDNPATFKLKDRYDFIPNELLKWEIRLPKIINKIYDFDVICLQEVDLINIHDIIDQLPEYNYYHHVIWKDEYKGKDIYKRTNPIGNITLWKKDIECLEQKANSCSIMTKLRIMQYTLHNQNNFEDFTLINVHLKGGLNCEKERLNQLKSCLKFQSTKTCICGDFNDEFNGELPKLLFEYNILANQLTCDCYNRGVHNYHSFDHIVHKGLNVNQESCPESQPIPNENEPSDHYPLIFTISI